MTTQGERSSGFRDSFRNSFRRWRRPYVERDQKKIGVLGAPQCRCTPLVLALCIALTGLVVVGVGACMAGFMWADDTPKALGLSLVGLGSVMIIAGIGLTIYDTKVRSLMPRPDPAANYSHQEQTNSRSPPPDLTVVGPDRGQLMGTITNVHAMPSDSGHGRRPHSQGIAPPAYDTVLQEDVRERSSHAGSYKQQQQPVPKTHGRGSHHSAARETRANVTSIV